MLRTNESVTHLDLGNTQIGTMTLIQLAKVMWYNRTVRVLNLEEFSRAVAHSDIRAKLTIVF